MNIKDSAFPQLHSIDGNWNKVPHPDYMGMTLRDYFAANAMQSLIMHYTSSMMTTDGDRDIFYKSISQCAYELADAMLEARK